MGYILQFKKLCLKETRIWLLLLGVVVVTYLFSQSSLEIALQVQQRNSFLARHPLKVNASDVVELVKISNTNFQGEERIVKEGAVDSTDNFEIQEGITFHNKATETRIPLLLTTGVQSNLPEKASSFSSSALKINLSSSSEKVKMWGDSTERKKESPETKPPKFVTSIHEMNRILLQSHLHSQTKVYKILIFMSSAL